MADVSEAKNFCNLQEITATAGKTLTATVDVNAGFAVVLNIYIKDGESIIDSKEVTPTAAQKAGVMIERLLYLNAKPMVAAL